MPARRRALEAAIALVVLAAWLVVAPRLPDAGDGRGALLAAALAGLVPVLAATLLLVRALDGPRPALVTAAVAAPVAVATVAAGWEAVATPARLVVATAIGVAVAAGAATARQLAVLAVAAALADAASVAAGPTRYAAESAPDALAAVGLLLPGLGGPPDALIGAVDIALLALLAAGARRTGLRAGATAAALCAAVALTALGAVVADRAIPAIPAMAVAFLAVNAGPLLRAPGPPEPGGPPAP